MKTTLLLFCFTVFSFVTFYHVGYITAVQDVQLNILNDPETNKALKHSCYNLTYPKPDYTQIYLGLKAACYVFEQENK